MSSSNNPLVSIILPAYNAEKYIFDSLKSCLEQTYKNIEVIVINDGSSDKTLDIVKSFHDERIKLISRENRGLVYSLNEGISTATGAYICRIDADDICFPNRVEEQLDIILSQNIDLVFSGAEIIDDDGNRITNAWIGDSTMEVLSRIRWYNTIYHPTVMFKKSSVVGVGGYRQLNNIFEDKDLWIRLLQRGSSFYYLKSTLIKYRLSKTSVHSDFSNYWLSVANSCIVNRDRKAALSMFDKVSMKEKIILLTKMMIPSRLLLTAIYLKVKIKS